MTIETKWSIGDSVWLMRNNKAIEQPISGIKTSTWTKFDGNKYSATPTVIDYEIKMGNDTLSLNDNLLFATKEELLASL